MVIEPIIPLVSGGSSTADNLCLARYRCNEFKGSRTEAADPRDGKLTLLFHPRLQRWSEHFTWRGHGDTKDGLTSCGRITIEALRLNNDWIVQARRLWMLVGLHPPLESSATGFLHTSSWREVVAHLCGFLSIQALVLCGELWPAAYHWLVGTIGLGEWDDTVYNAGELSSGSFSGGCLFGPNPLSIYRYFICGWMRTKR